MFHVLVLTHGRLGEELLASAREIAGEAPEVAALTLEWTDTFEQALDKVKAAVDEADGGEGVLVLTDIHGGTPFNVARSLAADRRLQIVTGVNLPMVLRLCCLEEGPRELEAAAAWIQGKGQASICRCQGEPPAGGNGGG